MVYSSEDGQSIPVLTGSRCWLIIWSVIGRNGADYNCRYVALLCCAGPLQQCLVTQSCDDIFIYYVCVVWIPGSDSASVVIWQVGHHEHLSGPCYDYSPYVWPTTRSELNILRLLLLLTCKTDMYYINAKTLSVGLCITLKICDSIHFQRICDLSTTDGGWAQLCQ